MLLPILAVLLLPCCKEKPTEPQKAQMPPALNLIADAELAESGVASAEMISGLMKFSEDLAASTGNAAQQAKAQSDRASTAKEAKTAKEKDNEALASLKAYSGTAYEKKEVASYFERRALRRKISMKERQANEAIEANDTISTKAILSEIDELKAKLRTAEDVWTETLYGGKWREQMDAVR